MCCTVCDSGDVKGVPGIEAVTRGRGGGWVSEGLKIFSSGPSKPIFKVASNGATCSSAQLPPLDS